MKSPYRALIWEQARTAGVLCLTIASMTLLMQITLFLSIDTRWMPLIDIVGSALVVTAGAMLLAAAVLLVRQNAQGNLALDFEPRLLHLPVTTLPMLALVFSSRVFCLVAMSCGLLASCWLLFGTVPEFKVLVVSLNLYFVAQALVWTRRTLTGVNYAVPLAALILVATLRYFGMREDALENFWEAVQAWVAYPVSLAVLFPAALMVSAVGVVLQRHDKRYGLPPVGEALDRLHDIRSTRARHFESPLEAQLWHEQRRVGRLLPALTLLFTLVFALVFSILPPNLSLGPVNEPWQTPYAGILAAAVVCGRIALHSRSKFHFHRPQTTTTAACALLLMQVRALFFCFLLVVGLSVLGMLLRGYDGVLLIHMLRVGDLDWIGAADLVLRPALAFTLIAWVLLWITTLPLLVPLICVVIAYIVVPVGLIDFMNDGFLRRATSFLDTWGYTLPVICLLFCIAGMTLAVTLRKGLFAPRHLFIGFVLWQNSILLLLVSTPYLGTHRYALVACATVGLLLVLPLTAVPLSFLRYRLKA